jgi:chromosome segregation ATPase
MRYFAAFLMTVYFPSVALTQGVHPDTLEDAIIKLAIKLKKLKNEDERGMAEKEIVQAEGWIEASRTYKIKGDLEQAQRQIERTEYQIELIESILERDKQDRRLKEVKKKLTSKERLLNKKGKELKDIKKRLSKFKEELERKYTSK